MIFFNIADKSIRSNLLKPCDLRVDWTISMSWLDPSARHFTPHLRDDSVMVYDSYSYMGNGWQPASHAAAFRRDVDEEPVTVTLTGLKYYRIHRPIFMY
jgi:hypothetical protein